MTIFPAVQRDLNATAVRQHKTRATRRRAGRVSLFAVAGLMALGGVAFAARAVGIWHPTSQQLHGAKLDVSEQAPPASQLAQFGVLRRAQTQRDKDAYVLTALQHSTNLQGIRTNYVRMLYQHGKSLFVLIPAERFHPRVPNGVLIPAGAQASLDVRDPLCLYVQDPKQTDSWTGGCQPTGRLLRANDARIGNMLYGLVPDAVRTVHVARRGAAPIEVPVHDNFYVATVPDLDAHPVYGLSWRDASGRLIGN